MISQRTGLQPASPSGSPTRDGAERVTVRRARFSEALRMRVCALTQPGSASLVLALREVCVLVPIILLQVAVPGPAWSGLRI